MGNYSIKNNIGKLACTLPFTYANLLLMKRLTNFILINNFGSRAKHILSATLVLLMLTSCVQSEDTSTSGKSQNSIAVENSDSPSISPTPSPTPTPTSYVQLITELSLYKETSASICEELSSEIGAEKEVLDQYYGEIQGIDEEPRKAQKGLANIAWSKNPKYRVNLGEKIEQELIWNSFSSSFSNEVLDEELFAEFTESIFSNCELNLFWEQTRTVANNLDSKLSKLNVASNLVPWYPDGFEEYQAGIAFKAKRGQLDCYSCRGLVYEVITKNGCSNRLYVQANFFTSSGTVYDWSNDVVYNLGAGQKALIELKTFRDSGGSGKVRITEISCS